MSDRRTPEPLPRGSADTVFRNDSRSSRSTDRMHEAVRSPAEVGPGHRARFCLAFSSPFLFLFLMKRTRSARTAKKAGKARPSATREFPAPRPGRHAFRTKHPPLSEGIGRSAPAVSPPFRTGAPVGRASEAARPADRPQRNDTTFSIPTTRNVHSEKTVVPPLSAPPKSSNALAFRCGTVSAAYRALPERKRSRRYASDRRPFPENDVKRHTLSFQKKHRGRKCGVAFPSPISYLKILPVAPHKRDARSEPSRSLGKSRKTDDQSTSISKIPTAASRRGVRCRRNASAVTFSAGCTTLNRSAATSNRSVT